MIKLLYYNVSQFKNDCFYEYLNLLPEFMRSEIVRYKDIVDQKCRLASRLMLLHAMKQAGAEVLFPQWKRDKNNKPFIEQWEYFNISHSGELVLFAYGSKPLGVDVEKKISVDHLGMVTYLHPEEQEFIKMSNDSLAGFYQIWVKKEALLKALGTGIVGDLSQFNCLKDTVCCGSTEWHFYEFSVNQQYSSCICFPEKNCTLLIEEFSPNNS